MSCHLSCIHLKVIILQVNCNGNLPSNRIFCLQVKVRGICSVLERKLVKCVAYMLSTHQSRITRTKSDVIVL